MKSSVRNIGILTWDYGNPKGGMGRSLQWIAEALRRGGMKVSVMSPSSIDENDREFLSFTNFIPCGHILFSLFVSVISPKLGFGYPSFGARVTEPALREKNDRNKSEADILLFPVGPGGIFLFRKPKHVRTIAIVYHTYFQQSRCVPHQWWKRIFVPLERRTLRHADQMLCFCEDTATVLQKSYGIARERITVLPHAIDLASWSVAAEMRHAEVGLCVCVARLEARKGIDVLLKSWPKVRAVFPHARLMIVGDGHLRGAVDRAVGHSDESMERISSLPFASLIALLHRAQIAVCPSYLEGFGLAAAEAMAAGTPVVASDCDGLRSMIAHGKTGWLTKRGDADDLAEGIIHFLADGQLRTKLASAALIDCRTRFDPERAASALLRAVDPEGGPSGR